MSDAEPIDWIVFADDWGRLPSTTQHLIRHLPDTDRVIWIDSIGMRTPRLTRSDLQRVWGKLRTLAGSPTDHLDSRPAQTERFAHIKPKVAPFHESETARSINKRSLSRDIRAAVSTVAVRRPVILISNTMGWLYVDAVRRTLIQAGHTQHVPVVYLRLDAFDVFPGVEAGLVQRTEPKLLDGCDAVFATAERIVPCDENAHKSVYLPQGVDLPHFARVPLDPPGTRTIGYYGNVAEWMDWPLVEAIVHANPAWRFEFVGPIRVPIPEALADAKNAVFPGPCPYPALPVATAHWDGAWMPFVINEHIQSANPLKMREYLAAGFPVACTPFAESYRVTADLCHVTDVPTFARFLEQIGADDRASRQARRSSVAEQGWAQRVGVLREGCGALLKVV